MPRAVARTDGAGLYMQGVYAALLAHERATYERRGGEPVVIDGCEIGKKQPAHADEHGKEGFFLYPRRDLLNRLEAAEAASEAVVVGRGKVELALWERDRPPRPVRLPFAQEVRWVGVSPDDRITSRGNR
jgi:hypothetical protein